LPILHAIVLGITQGLSEFLPISSSGHLRLVPWLFGWDDFAGRPSFEQTFDVALHLGTLLGAIAYFRRDLVRLVSAGLTRPKSHDGRLAWLLVLSAVPAALVGGLLGDSADKLARHEWLIGVLLVVFGLVLLWADRLGGERNIETLRPRDAIVMGAAQALALAPGVSRSGATITAGRWLAFDRDSAARVSFLMSLPVIAGALVLKGAGVVGDGMPEGFGPAFAWGIAASGVTGWLAVWATLRIIRTRSFAPFVAYRVVVGLGVVVLAATSFR
jgi:undecaprenyl-diphosphatase